MMDKLANQKLNNKKQFDHLLMKIKAKINPEWQLGDVYGGLRLIREVLS